MCQSDTCGVKEIKVPGGVWCLARTFVQEPQRRNERAGAALEKDELSARIGDHLNVILAFAHDERLLLGEDVFHILLKGRILLQDLRADGALLGGPHG